MRTTVSRRDRLFLCTYLVYIHILTLFGDERHGHGHGYGSKAFGIKVLNRMEGLDREISFMNGEGKSLDAYNNVSNSVTFIQYQAGAMGGNFQKANKIIYYTLPLGKGSCDLWEQSKKRIHRIGQKSTCFYYYLLVKGSIEEKNFRALKEGKELTDELFT